MVNLKYLISFFALFMLIDANDFTQDEILEAANNMKFIINTRENPTELQFFNLNDIQSLKNTTFKKERPVKINIHGWLGNYKIPFGILIKQVYLIQRDVNVITIDWGKEAMNYWYPTSRSKVPLIGTVVAFMLDELARNFNVDMSNVHIIGHSLGAHIAGVAGLKVTKGRLDRITGLDPAGKGFSYSDEMRISKKSAKFVDIIHTDIHKAGFPGPLGHIDFYPNGGYNQPMDRWQLLTPLSHRRAYWLFAESVLTPGGFLAKECQDWTTFQNNDCFEGGKIAEMGEYVNTSSRGTYYLVTNSQTPFSRGERSLIYD